MDLEEDPFRIRDARVSTSCVLSRTASIGDVLELVLRESRRSAFSFRARAVAVRRVCSSWRVRGAPDLRDAGGCRPRGDPDDGMYRFMRWARTLPASTARNPPGHRCLGVSRRSPQVPSGVTVEVAFEPRGNGRVHEAGSSSTSVGAETRLVAALGPSGAERRHSARTTARQRLRSRRPPMSSA
jgi:hypothetical protein